MRETYTGVIKKGQQRTFGMDLNQVSWFEQQVYQGGFDKYHKVVEIFNGLGIVHEKLKS